jgi:DNA-binding NarL/FixJ family response regulator
MIVIGERSEGAARDLFAALNELYVAAGAPSVRAIAERTHALSRDTVHRALTGDKPPKWSTLHDIVVALDGDVEQFRAWWTAAVGATHGTATSGVVVESVGSGKTDLLVRRGLDESTSSGALRVALVDDHDIVLRGLRQLFEDAGFEIAGEAADAPDAVSMVLDAQPDVVVMDVRMPSGDGIDATAQILAQRPDTKVLVLTSYSDEGAIREAVRVGARGYLLKQTSGDDLIRAVQDVAGGKTYWAHPKAAEFAADPANHGRASERSPRLTSRELQVLALVCEGLTNHEIAGRLSISMGTTDTYISRIMAKLGTNELGANGRVKTVLYAIKHGLVAGVV